ncbi:hypothetical protein B0T10DRAFT_238964 [Thelonectria olida]|uniref:N-acetyltransferase domain-containing protein n=1 Tax=Thelonectria olida TaxID=1576542 RepID=A0A9P9ASQ3_9HYPO|nr:hypothetical protein B0T10DRAFT_238964 [Thelonectria olida]
MSLPSSKPAQLSIRSFFQAKTPKYAPPPSSRSANPPGSSSTPPTDAASAPPPFAAPPIRSQEAKEEEGEGLTSAPPPPVKSTTAPANGSSIPPLPATLPREAAIRPVTGNDVNALRRINALLLPVNYPDSFYKRAVEGPISRVITWAHDGAEPKVVGGVVCRIEPDLVNGAPSEDGTVSQILYIQSLCLLSPYRGMGLINAAVDNIVAAAVAEKDLNVTNVTAHVWTENEDGLKWYKGRGFQLDDAPIRGYYMKLRPDTAWLVRRPVSALVRHSLSSVAAPTLRSVPPSTTASIVNLPPMSGPPRGPNAPPLPRTSSSQSYQNRRADMEWNDLPDDMATSGRLRPPNTEPVSSASSRSSSTARKKRDRAYPAAAFGS